MFSADGSWYHREESAFAEKEDEPRSRQDRPVGFVLSENPPTLLIPDLSFVSAERVATHGLTEYVCRFPPDLAAEILMPNDTYTTILDKVLAYLAAGTRIVWVVDPYTESVTVYRGLEDVRVLTVGDALEAQEVLSGFRMEVAEVFST